MLLLRQKDNAMLNVDQIPRVTPREVREKMSATPRRVHLVCAYADDAKCRQFPIEGAETVSGIEARRDTLERDSILVFYCA